MKKRERPFRRRAWQPPMLRSENLQIPGNIEQVSAGWTIAFDLLITQHLG